MKWKDPQTFHEKLMGPIGHKAIFIPIHGFVPFLPPRNTPPASTPPNAPVQAPPVENELVKATKRSTRILEKRAYRWTNTPDDPVELGD